MRAPLTCSRAVRLYRWNSNEYENLSNFIIEEVKNEDIDDLENLSNKVNKYDVMCVC